MADFAKLTRAYARVADFATVYIAEAHPSDEWALPHAEGTPSVRQPRGTEERVELARCFAQTVRRGEAKAAGRAGDDAGADADGEGGSAVVGIGAGALLVDTLTNEASLKYAAWPERLYIIVDDVIVYKGGPGPFGYVLEHVQKWLAEKFPGEAA